MNAMTDDRNEKNRAAWDRFYRTFANAKEAANKKSYATTSADGTVLIAMGSDYRARLISIHPDAADEIQDEQLETAVISAYNNARKAVHTGQRNHILRQLGIETEGCGK